MSPGTPRTPRTPRVEPTVVRRTLQDRGMSSRIAAIAIDAVQRQVVADFWCGVLGWQLLQVDEGVLTIGSPGGAGPTIDVAPVPEPKTVKNRLHLDLRAADPAGELERLLGLGARRVDVGQAPTASWVVLADPEGNEFCLLGART
jgi:hypothetical protein